VKPRRKKLPPDPPAPLRLDYPTWTAWWVALEQHHATLAVRTLDLRHIDRWLAALTTPEERPTS
jgi:hypothetical protein